MERSKTDYIGVPPADLSIQAEDRLILYGRQHRLRELSNRASGDEAAHRKAKEEHERDVDEQREQIDKT